MPTTNLPPNREIKRLGEICKLQNGFAFKAKDYIDFSNTLNFRMSNIRPGGGLDLDHNKKYLPDNYIIKYSNFLLKDGDIVIAMTDMATNPKILAIPTVVHTDGRKLLLNQRVGRFFIEEKKLNPQYLRYVLLTPKLRNELVRKGGGGIQINLGSKDILNTEIPLPPLSEQKRIVAKLDEISHSIQTSQAEIRSQLSALDELWESTLHQAFDNEEWEKVKLEKILNKTYQKKPQNNPETTFTYIDISSIDNKIHKITSPNNFIGKNAPSRAKKEVQKGDIIFSLTRPNLKNIAIIEQNYDNVIASTGFAVCRASDKIIAQYLFYFLSSNIIQVQITPFIRGAQYPAISEKDLLCCKIPLPPLSEQKKIVTYLDQVNEKITKLKTEYTAQLDHYDQLRASILDQAFKGEL